jgi:general secretion pathway protein I
MKRDSMCRRRGSFSAHRRGFPNSGAVGNRAARMRGFTLLEVMLAFALLAFAMGLLIGMLANGLHQVSRAESSTEATLYAQSLLDPMGTLEPITPGERDGYFRGNRYHWRLQVTPVADPAPRTAVPPAVPTTEVLTPPVLYSIALDVSWGAGQPAQTLHFATLRARTPPSSGATP